MTIKESIIEALILVQTPLSIREIFSKIIELDLYQFKAAKPEHIVQIEVRRHCEGLDFPSAHPKKYFQILSDGKYWIKDLPVPGATQASQKLEEGIKRENEVLKSTLDEVKQVHKKHEDTFKKATLKQLMEIDPKIFEQFGQKLLEVYGFKDVHVTQYVRDGGLDGYGKLKIGITYLNVAFQCKRWKNKNVGREEVDKFRGAIQGDFEQGIIFTTSSFSKDAQKAMTKKGAVPIVLIDGSTLVDIMIEKRFGVDVETMPVYVNALDKVLTE